MASVKYLEYLRSPQWKRKRALVLHRDKHECRRCGSKKQLEVHHLTYARIFREKAEDLLTLCRTCHQKVHLPSYAQPEHIPRKPSKQRGQRLKKSKKKRRDMRAEVRRQRRESVYADEADILSTALGENW